MKQWVLQRPQPFQRSNQVWFPGVYLDWVYAILNTIHDFYNAGMDETKVSYNFFISYSFPPASLLRLLIYLFHRIPLQL